MSEQRTLQNASELTVTEANVEAARFSLTAKLLLLAELHNNVGEG